MTTSKFVVCPQCRGTGYGDNLGDVTEAIHEDPDFADDYRAGLYNTGCERCRGRNVVPACQTSGCDAPVEAGFRYVDDIPDPNHEGALLVDDLPYEHCFEHLPKDQRDELVSNWETDAMYAAERRMGA